MSLLRSGAQLIIQVERGDGRFDCLGFGGLPVVNPVFIALTSAATPQARNDLNDLRRKLLQELSVIAPKMQSIAMPCGGIVPDPGGCHAHGEPDCQKLLILVGDSTQPIQLHSFHQLWTASSGNYRVLPIFRSGSRLSITNLLPAQYLHLNVEFWSRSIDEALPAILALSNLTSEAPRIFISYRQKDAPALAIQLFDSLSHQNFDTFLDHFRIPPGVNFQARLTQELGDKSMVLLIESEHLLDSEWTMYEIGVAKACSLGILALHVPSGPLVPGIDPAIRMSLNHSDFQGGHFSPSSELDATVVSSVVQRVKLEHDRALIRRRQILKESLEGALLQNGVSAPVLGAGGALQVQSRTGSEYMVWLTPRPPELPDFHVVHGQSVPPVQGVVVGLSRLMEPVRLAQTGWLAGLSNIKMVDEGHLKVAASQMAQGTL
jgi:hypothetical protein